VNGSGAMVSTRFVLDTYLGSGWPVTATYLVILILGSAIVLWAWWRPEASLVHMAGLTFAVTLLISPHAQLHDYIVLLLPLLQISAGQGASQPTPRYLRLAWLLLACWLVVSLDAWFHSWLEQESTWAWLSGRLGEE